MISVFTHSFVSLPYLFRYCLITLIPSSGSMMVYIDMALDVKSLDPFGRLLMESSLLSR
jgi:hypothetical protein